MDQNKGDAITYALHGLIVMLRSEAQHRTSFEQIADGLDACEVAVRLIKDGIDDDAFRTLNAQFKDLAEKWPRLGIGRDRLDHGPPPNRW